jgi:hypothetical protein
MFGGIMRTYIGVTLEFDINGKTKPLAIKWVDGRTFAVDRVLDTRAAPSLKAGGHGMRYTCRIAGKQVYLFFDDLENKWYIEK